LGWFTAKDFGTNLESSTNDEKVKEMPLKSKWD